MTSAGSIILRIKKNLSLVKVYTFDNTLPLIDDILFMDAPKSNIMHFSALSGNKIEVPLVLVLIYFSSSISI